MTGADHDLTIVQHYLAAIAARDFATARQWLTISFEMIFPGGVRFTDPEDVLAWSRGRYRRIEKIIAGFDCAPGEGGSVVLCRGTLAGVWPDGGDFTGIRFIDRFELAGGKIGRQEVWNDLAEMGKALRM